MHPALEDDLDGATAHHLQLELGDPILASLIDEGCRKPYSVHRVLEVLLGILHNQVQIPGCAYASTGAYAMLLIDIIEYQR
jgi:hypothetical protein